MLASAAHILKLEQYREDGCIREVFHILGGFPRGLDGKESACNAGDLGSTPGLGRSPGEGKGYPLQYSGLENSMDLQSMAWQRHD